MIVAVILFAAWMSIRAGGRAFLIWYIPQMIEAGVW